MSLLLSRKRCLFTLVVAIYTFASWPKETQALCPLDSASFELITNIRHILGDTNVDIRLEERYSGEQSRGMVKMRAYGLADYATLKKDAGLDFEAATFFYDSQENISLRYNDGSSACKRVDPDALLRAAGIYFKPADEPALSQSQKHLIGSARWLKYFCERRSELKADMSDLPFTVRNVPSVRYTTSFTNELGTRTEVGVYYREASLTQQERENAMPDRIVFKTAGKEESVSTLLDISPVKFITSDQEYVPADSDDLGADLELDHMLLTHVPCQAQVFAWVNKQPVFGHDRIRRASFSAHVVRDHHEYTTQVAYDGHLKMMRVDLATPRMPVKCSKQIFNFYRNKMYLILEQAHLRRNLLLEHLVYGATTMSPQQRATPIGPAKIADPTETGAGQILNLADTSSSSACSGAQLTTKPELERKHTLGDLLLGSNNFMFLGRARVRGIRAFVYTAIGSQLPYWLEAPVDGNDPPPNKLRRPLQYVTHLFVSEVPLEHPDEDSQILMLQIYRMDMDCKFVYEKYTIPIYDFSWTLRSMKSACTVASDGGDGGTGDDDDEDFSNLADLFSIANRCTGSVTSGARGTEGDEHGRFELLLESVGPPVEAAAEKSWLAVAPSELKLVTLAALQSDVNMMVDIIYGLETKLIDGASENNAERRLSIMAEFNMARYLNATTRVTYVGQGYRLVGNSIGWAVTSFHQCYMLAAYRNQQVDFAYDEVQHYCYIGVLPSVGAAADSIQTKGRSFEVNKLGNLRVYQTFKSLTKLRQGMFDYFASAHDIETKHVRLRERRLAMAPAGCPSTKFRIKRMHIHHLFEPTGRLDVSAADDDSSGIDDKAGPIRELVGFGMREEQGLSQLVFMPPGEDSIQHEESLTLDQCQALCLGNFECRSVSYCVRGAHAECILSLVDLSAHGLAMQIKSQVQKEPSKRNIEVTVEMGQAEAKTIMLIKQPSCAIYNKQFLQYFEPLEEGRIPLRFVSLARVASVEECARTCFNSNLASLRAHNELFADALARLDRAVIERSRDDQADALKAVEQLERQGAQIRDCEGFNFIPALQLFEMGTSKTLERLKSFAEEIKEKVSFDVDDTTTETTAPEAGICLYSMRPRHPSDDGNAQAPKLNLDLREESFEFEEYDLNVANLFEEEHGVRLLSSKLTTEEEAAYQNVLSASSLTASEESGKPDSKSIEIVRRLLRQGENFQNLSVRSRKICASLCFKQANNLWPACRSFDLYIEMSPNGYSIIKCAQNSMTKRQLIEMKRSDLIDSTIRTNAEATKASDPKRARTIVDCWHYEPKEGLLTGQWALEEESAVSSLLRQLGGSGASSLEFFHREFLFLIMATGLALGLYLGMTLMRYAKNQGYLNSQFTARPRGDSISSTRALDMDDSLDLPPI